MNWWLVKERVSRCKATLSLGYEQDYITTNLQYIFDIHNDNLRFFRLCDDLSTNTPDYRPIIYSLAVNI